MEQEDIITTSKEVQNNRLMNFIIEVVQRYLDVPEEYNTRRTRKREVVFARQVAMYLIRKYTNKDVSLANIGRKFGNKDHATVLHGVKTVMNLMEFDRQIRDTVNEIDNLIKLKSRAVSDNLDLQKDYYHIDLSSFVSLKLEGEKSILLSGFNDQEIEVWKQTLRAIKEHRIHENTGMYILEKRQQNDGQENEEDKGEVA